MREHDGDRIVLALQLGIPLEPRPFAVLAEALDLTEADVLETARGMLAEGSARRFGAVFDARRLGYRSELCAVNVDDVALDEVGALIAAQPGVTHCYLRGHPPGLEPFPTAPGVAVVPNVWFTLAALWDRFDAELAALQAALGRHRIWRLPAVRRFKIDVVFDPRRRDAAERVPGVTQTSAGYRADPSAAATVPEAFDEAQRDVVRALQGNVPPRADFYAGIGETLGIAGDALLDQLRTWADSGTLRRMAMIVRHRRIGFKANAMCVWPVNPDAVMAAGRRLACWDAVTHCYERKMLEGWPYTLYAMIHMSTWQGTRELFDQISQDAGLENGRMLGSLREFKKASMNYFGERDER